MTEVTFEQAMQIATQHYEAGRLQECESICRQLLARDPNHANALHMLGLVAFRVNHRDAASLIRRAIALQPNNAQAYSNLGLVLLGQRDSDGALEAFRQALALEPNLPEAHYNLGYAFHIRGETDSAIACYRRTLALRSNYAPAYLNLGTVLDAQGHFDEAVGVYRQGIALDPKNAKLFSNLGHTLWKQSKRAEAIDACRRAVALDPNFPEAQCNLGNALLSERRYEDAIFCYRRAIALLPDYADAHTNLALALLTIGQFEEGWREHEWRWKKPTFPSVRRNFTQPLWDGTDLEGKTILLHAEQGFGDAIQFARFAPQVAKRGGRVVIECQPQLLRLFQNARDLAADSVIVQSPTGEAPPVAFDVHCPLMSLPLALKMYDPARIPSPVPYLYSDGLSEAHWRDRVETSAAGKRLKVGLVWTGSAVHSDDPLRSLKLEQFAPLARTDLQYFSLQVGRGSEEAAQPPQGLDLTDFTPQLADFADTAGLISQLDLVITIDTAVAHLAGAMGKPVWVLVPFRPDFRWQLDREDTSWYPTMRLFRQLQHRNWADVVSRISEALDSTSQVAKLKAEPAKN